MTGNSKGGRFGGQTSYQRQMSKGSNKFSKVQGQTVRVQQGSAGSGDRTRFRLEGDDIDNNFGFERLKEGPARLGWLLNFMPITMADEHGMEKSGLDMYFVDSTGENFKASIFFAPYFYLVVNDTRRQNEVCQQLQKRYETCTTELVKMEDLEMVNHLSGKQHQLIKVSFGTVNEMMEVKQVLRPLVTANQKRVSGDYYDDEEYHYE